MTFEELELSPAILKALQEKGYVNPTPIQAKAIPAVLAGRDVLAAAQTGTGKTAGFTLPILEKLSQNPSTGKKAIKALILTPTRELAAQIFDNVNEYSQHLPIRSTVIFGGVGMRPQIDSIRKGSEVVIATPGRLLDLHSQGHVDLRQLEILVLDEADRMLDMGFSKDIHRILKLIPQKRQTLLFSATFNSDIKKMTETLLRDPVKIEIEAENSTVDRIDQMVYRVDKDRKTELLIHLINEGNWQQVLVFTRTKHGADRLAKKLDRAKIRSSAIHGDKSQNQRTRALAGFKAWDTQVLVATDIAARGIDIQLLPHVVNFEMPNSPEDYVHRIGRTGRAGKEGIAVSLVSYDEESNLKDIEKFIDKKIPNDVVEGFEPDLVKAALEAKQNEKKPKQRFGGNKRPNSGGGNRPKSNKPKRW